MDSVGPSSSPASSPPPEKPGSKEASEQPPHKDDTRKYLLSGDRIEGASLGKRKHSTTEASKGSIREHSDDFPLPPSKYLHHDPEAVSAYLDSTLTTFRKHAELGHYQEALDCCKRAIDWMKDNRVQDKEKYDLLSDCRNGCCFACHLLRNPDRPDLWVKESFHALWGMNFILHVLLDSGRYQEPSCEFDLPRVLQIIKVIGQKGVLSNKYWHITLAGLADIIRCEEFSRPHPVQKETLLHTGAGLSPREVSYQCGKLFEQYPVYQAEVERIKSLPEGEEQFQALDAMSLQIKQHCAQSDYDPDAILEAGALIAALHNEQLRKTRVGNRLLRVMNDFGMAAFRPSDLQLRDLTRSAIALCNWRFPGEITRPLLQEGMDKIHKLQSDRKITREEAESALKSIREIYANTYGCILTRDQEDVDHLISQNMPNQAKERLLKLLEDRYFYAGELNAIRLQLATCYCRIDEYSHMVAQSLSHVINKGFFGVRKAEILAEYGDLESALDVIAEVKKRSPSEKDDFGPFTSAYILKLEADIQKRMISKKLLRKELFPDRSELQVSVAELTEELEQLHLENRRLNRRVNAKKMHRAEEEKKTEELQRTLGKQAEAIRESQSQLLQAASYKQERDKLMLKVQNLTSQVEQLTLAASNSQPTDERYEKLRKIQKTDREQAYRYRREREDLKISLQSTITTVQNQKAELELLRSQVSGLQAVVKTQQQKLKPPLVEGPSDIAGDGLFAGSDIKLGSLLGEYTGEKVYRLYVPATGRYVLWHYKDSGEPEFLDRDYHIVWVKDPNQKPGSPEAGVDAELINLPARDKCPLRLMNHSANYNVQLMVTPQNRVMAIACRDIQEGEELLWSYDTGRKELFQLMEHEQYALHKQDHIEQHPLKHILFDPESGEVSLKPSSKRKGRGRGRPLWQ